ncbi:MAG: sigma-70 family RNA polymerase sigma factor [Sedimentisphaerales bacterium]|nr:sigma-70 family RNA polymerase sigma factor [Sedimentisphaerales bacterium]
MEPPTEIIQQCQQGRAEAFAWLVEHYGPSLYRFFLRCTGRQAEAEDLLQDVFLRLLEKIGGYRQTGRFEHWLYRVAANLVRDRGRRHQRLQKRLRPVDMDPADLAAESDLDGRPERGLERDEQGDLLQQALKELPELDREIILLRYYGDMSFREIAQQYQMPLGTAIAKVHRGLKRLRGFLSTDETETRKIE